MQLYSILHNQWTYRNSVLHERDAQGLRIKEGEELEQQIETQFELGRDGLNPSDWHYIERGRTEVGNLSASDKKAWLSGITIARESAVTATARAAANMRANMHRWLQPSQG